MVEEVVYIPRPPREERDRTVSEDKRHRLQLKKGFKDAPETTIRRSDARRRIFIASNPLPEGCLYVSWIHPNGGRRHAVIREEESMELSRDGEQWLRVATLTESIDTVLKALEDEPLDRLE